MTKPYTIQLKILTKKGSFIGKGEIIGPSPFPPEYTIFRFPGFTQYEKDSIVEVRFHIRNSTFELEEINLVSTGEK